MIMHLESNYYYLCLKYTIYKIQKEKKTHLKRFLKREESFFIYFVHNLVFLVGITFLNSLLLSRFLTVVSLAVTYSTWK